MKTARQLCIVRGVTPVVHEKVHSLDEFISVAREEAVKSGLAAKGDAIVVVCGAQVASGTTNTSSVQVL